MAKKKHFGIKQLTEQLKHPRSFFSFTHCPFAKLLVNVHSFLYRKIIHKHIYVCMKGNLVFLPNRTVSGTSSLESFRVREGKLADSL